MRRNAIAAVLSILALASVTVRPAAPQAPTFRSGVALVTIDVTVLDKNGRPVPGLSAEDFEIRLNGRPQPVRALAFVQVAPPSPAPASTPAPPATAPAARPAPAAVSAPSPDAPRRTWSNEGAPAAPDVPGVPGVPAASTAPVPAPMARGGEPRVFVVLVDDLSFAPQRGKALFAAAARFVDRVPEGDPVGFTTTSGVGAINPTRNRAAVKAALAKVVGAFDDPRGIIKSGPSPGGRMGGTGIPDANLGIAESIDIERGDETMLKQAIVRECFNGNIAVFNSVSLAQMLIEDRCASDVQREARRVAALARQNKGRQIEGVKNVIAAMKAASGIRHLVLLTDGVPVSREVNDLSPLVRAAAEAGVQISVLLEEPDINLQDEGRRQGDPGVVPQTDPGTARRRREDNMLLVDGAQTMSDMAGGTFYRVIGNADAPFDKVLTVSSAVYRLGVELPAGAPAGKDLQVAVSVKRAGLSAKANRMAVPASAVAEPAAPPAPTPATEVPKTLSGAVAASIDDVIKAALNSSAMASGVPIRMAATVRRSNSAAGLVDVSVNAEIPAASPGPLTAIVGVVDASGAMRVSRRVVDAAPGAAFSVQYLFPLEPGDYRIRLGVADMAGAIGTLEVPVHATLAAVGTMPGALTASDVLTWFVDASNRAQLFTLETVPDGLDTLHASLELYPAGAMPLEPPAVHWTLTRDGDTTPLLDADTDARPSATLLRADAEFPVAALPAGTYVLTAKVRVGDVTAGTRAAVIRKR